MDERKLLPEWRELAHKKLDEVLDMYEQGYPLWITTTMAWFGTDKAESKLDITIRPW